MNFGVRKLDSRGYRVALFAWPYTFSRFDRSTIPECDRQTHTHTHTHIQMDIRPWHIPRFA